MEDLPGLDRIEYKTNDRTREILERWWNENFITPVGNGMPVGYIDVAWQMIERGFGYTLCFLPEHFANEHNLCLTPLFWKDGTPVERNTWFSIRRVSGCPRRFRSLWSMWRKVRKLGKIENKIHPELFTKQSLT
ncbi:MAG: hypothetical protein ACLTR6_12835 [Clostridium fessum]